MAALTPLGLPYDAESVCALLSTALESSPVPVVVSRIDDGCIVYVNAAFTRVFEHPPEQVLGRTATEAGLWLDPAQRAPIIERIARGEPVVDVDIRYRARSGRVGDLQVTANLVHIEGVAHLVGILNDVTAAKEAERDRRQAQSHLAIVLNAARTVVFHQDRDLRYTRVANPVLGVAEHEIIGRTDDEMLDAPSAAAVGAMKRRVIETGIGDRQTLWVRNANGHAGWFDLLVEAEFDLDGRVTGILAAAADVTAAHAQPAPRAGEPSTAPDAAAAAIVARSAFIASLGHDLRTPVNAIQGMSFLLRRSGLSPEQMERVEKIEEASRRFLEIIDPVVELARIEAGRVAVRDEPLDLATLVQETATRVQWKAQGTEVRVALEPFPAGVRGDAVHLQKLLSQYAANALEFGAAGAITVRARPLAIGADHVLARLEVHDTGPGIDPAIVPRMFELGPPHGDAAARDGGRRGIGLVIARRLAQLMGGDAGVESPPGEGCTFWFTARLGLPAQP